MDSVLIWGKTREIITGDLAPGLTADEVDSFSALRARLDSGASLVLVDLASLEADGGEIEAWLRNGGSLRATLVAVTDASNGDAALRRFPFLDDLLFRPVLAARLDRAIETIKGRRVIRQLQEKLARKNDELHAVNKIGVALSAERDISKLMQLILQKSREITDADAGSLYLVERGKEHETQTDDQLRFKLAQNDSVVYPFEETTMPLNERSIAGYVALTGKPVNVPDCYHLPPECPYKVSRSFDEKSGYRTKSVLVVPMRDHQNTVIGAVQLINKKRDFKAVLQPVDLVDEMVIPFTSVDEELVGSLASQAAVAYENTRLIQDIKNLFDSFVRASVTAIESRDPTTSGHSDRVATLTVGIAEHVDALATGPFRDVRFTRDQLQEIRYASLLHDFGKVGVREKVLIKGKKLYVGEQMVIQQRFSYIKRSLEAEYLRAKLEQVMAGRGAPALLAEMDAQYEERQKEIDDILRMVLEANKPSVLEEESFRALMDLPKRTYVDLAGERQPFLTDNEVLALSITQGSLSDKERREIESHVTHTFRFLSQIPWTGEYRNVPDIAYAHHEKLDGSGYPRRLSGRDIPLQSRMMTIADIYDALVAWDRPYKSAVPVEKALDILRDDVRRGKLDGDLLDVFVEAKVYEKMPPRAGSEAELAR
jgi:HD-GYP domain-containing protein (c-di-GMP phosphodiesterase class II)